MNHAHALVLAAVTLLAACASHTDDARAPAIPPRVAEAPSGETKVRAPVELALTASGEREALTLSLRIQATSEIPRAVARFVLPAGVTLLSGALEQELGALLRDEVRTVTIAVRAQAPAPTIVAGVDCHLSSGVKLYRATTLTLAGAIPEPGVRPHLLREGAVRATPARPRTR